MGKSIPHGTVTGYGRHYRCRCADCRAANAAACREYAAKRRAEGRPLKGGYRHKRDLVCEHCGSDFRAESARQRFCSMACFGDSNRKVYSTELVHVGPKPEPVAPPVPVTVVSLPKWWGVIVNGPCAWCSENFTATSGAARYCSKRCSGQAGHARSGRFIVEPRFRYAIYQRDDWTCQLCLEPVERDGDKWGDWAPSLDHVVPRSKGGSDDWDNLRLAHRWCNAVRGAEDYHSDLFGEVERVAS